MDERLDAARDEPGLEHYTIFVLEAQKKETMRIILGIYFIGYY